MSGIESVCLFHPTPACELSAIQDYTRDPRRLSNCSTVFFYTQVDDPRESLGLDSRIKIGKWTLPGPGQKTSNQVCIT